MSMEPRKRNTRSDVCSSPHAMGWCLSLSSDVFQPNSEVSKVAKRVRL
jgi:hypothetical protein